MSKHPIVLGMDLETNGSTQPPAVPIQIGIFGISPNGGTITYESMIYWPHLHTQHWSSEAEEIHGFSYNDMRQGQPVSKVVADIRNLFAAQQVVKPWCTGFNVAGFDLATLGYWSGPLWNLFSHRSVDLNALCQYLGSIGLPRTDSPKPWNFQTLKKRVKRLAAAKLDADGWDRSNIHDAFYDAMLAYEVWNILQEIAEPWVGLVRQSKEGIV